MDLADDSVVITGPISGLSFEISIYRMYRQMQLQVMMAWGVAGIKPNHVATLRG